MAIFVLMGALVGAGVWIAVRMEGGLGTAGRPAQVGAVNASTYVSGLSATAVAVAFVVVLRSFGTVAAPGPRPVPCDSWCSPREPAKASAT